MGISFGNAVKYLFNGVSKIGRVVEGITSLLGGGITQAVNLLGRQGNTADMTSAEDTVYSSLAINFWSSIIFSVLSFVMTILTWFGFGDTYAVFGFITCFFSILGLCISIAISLGINGAIIYFGDKYKTRWYFILVQIWTVLTFISLVVNAISGVTNVIGVISALIKLNFYSVILRVINVLQVVVSIGASGLLLKGLCMCNVTTDVNRQNEVQNAFNDTFNMGDQNNYNNQNGYNQNGFNGQNVAGGLVGLGAVGSQNGSFDSGMNQNNAPAFDLSKNNGQSTDNQYNQPMDNQYNQGVNGQPVAQPQMYACPYCGQAIPYGVQTCQHCNQPINWGN